MFKFVTSLAFFATLALPTTSAFAFQDVDTPDDGDGDQTEECQHRGAKWVDAKVVASGVIQCPSVTFTLTIGVSQGGGAITVNWPGCPSYIDIEPGHGELVQKLHYNPVGPQQLNWQRQSYTAFCGSFWSNPSCTPNGGPTNLPTTVNHWQEQACPVVTQS